MNLRLYTSKEDYKNFSKSFSTKLYPKFERSTFLFVDFSIDDSHKDVFKIQVFYSENGFFYTKFNTNNLIRHAFGKWDALSFMLAKNENKALNPLFIFDFPLNNSKSPYDAVFANINGELHILSKIYNLSDKHYNLLKKSYILYKIKGADYTLFDFGNCFSFIDKFLINLETVLEDVDFKLNDSNELIINPISLDSIRKREDDYKYCMICGKKLEPTLNKNLLDLSKKFPARCESCLKKIYVLELYYKLNDGYISNDMISISELKYIWDEEGLFEYNFKLLKEYGFLKPFSGDIYKIYINEDINNDFNQYLNLTEEKIEESESKLALDDYFGFSDEKEKPKCRICGEEIEEEGNVDICSNCFDKQMTIEKIHKLIEYVKPGSGFSKSSLIEKGFNHIDLDIIIFDLEDNGLLRYDSDDLIILDNITKLNEFIKEYSDSDEYIIEIDDEEIPKLSIYETDLKTEDKLDKVINLIDYQNFVECNFNNQDSTWLVALKKDGQYFLSQKFNTPFQAKLIAIRYLGEIGVINIVKDNYNSKLENNQSLWEPKENKSVKNIRVEENKEFAKECPICGEQFQSELDSHQECCDVCKIKYPPFERQVLIGIKKGIYTKATAIRIRGLLNQGYPKLKVSQKLDLDSPDLIDPILKFLLPDNYDLKRESLEKSFPGKKCLICGNVIAQKNYSTNRKYCDECKSKYKPAELSVLVGIKEGKFTQETAISIKNLKEEGKTNSKIAQILGLSPIVIPHILKFLLSDNSPSSNLEKDSDDGETRICPICKRPFKGNKKGIGQKYCNDCLRKFTPTELTVLLDIENGTYTKDLALEIVKYKNEGKSDNQITNLLKLPHPGVINPIIQFLLEEYKIEDFNENNIENESDKSEIEDSDEVIGKKESFKENESDKSEIEDSDEVIDENKPIEEEKICPICYNKFYPKSSDESEVYCPVCKKRFTPNEIQVLMGVIEGKYTTKLANRLKNLQDVGFSDTFISSEENVPLDLITPIIWVLLDDDGKIEGISYNKNLSKWFVYVKNKDKYVNLGFYKTKEEAILAKDKYFKSLNNNEEEFVVDQDEIYDDLKILKDKDSWFVYYKDNLLGIFSTKGKAYRYLKLYSGSDTEENNVLKKELITKDMGNSYNIVLNGFISEEDRLAMFKFIPLFSLDFKKLLCDKIEDNYFKFLLDFNIEKSDLETVLNNLKQLGWE